MTTKLAAGLNPRLRAQSNRNVFAVAVVAAIVFVVSARLIHVAVLQHPELKRRADQQTVVRKSLPAYRGTITDRTGLPVSFDAPRLSIAADPRLAQRPEASADTLAKLLGIDRDGILRKLTSKKRFVFISRFVSEGAARDVALARLPGVYRLADVERHKPDFEATADIVGSVDNAGAGPTGLEALLEPHLSPSQGSEVTVRGARGELIQTISRKNPRDGRPMRTTLDLSLLKDMARDLQVGSTATVVARASNDSEWQLLAHFSGGSSSLSPLPCNAANQVNASVAYLLPSALTLHLALLPNVDEDRSPRLRIRIAWPPPDSLRPSGPSAATQGLLDCLSASEPPVGDWVPFHGPRLCLLGQAFDLTPKQRWIDESTIAYRFAAHAGSDASEILIISSAPTAIRVDAGRTVPGSLTQC